MLTQVIILVALETMQFSKGVQCILKTRILISPWERFQEESISWLCKTIIFPRRTIPYEAMSQIPEAKITFLWGNPWLSRWMKNGLLSENIPAILKDLPLLDNCHVHPAWQLSRLQGRLAGWETEGMKIQNRRRCKGWNIIGKGNILVRITKVKIKIGKEITLH